jgi:hypothetical protein
MGFCMRVTACKSVDDAVLACCPDVGGDPVDRQKRPVQDQSAP